MRKGLALVGCLVLGFAWSVPLKSQEMVIGEERSVSWGCVYF